MTGLEALLKTLGEAGVQFVVIGGVAMYAHGSTRLTRDLDICYERSPANLERLARALSDYHPRLRGVSDSVAFCLDGRALSRGMNFTLSTDLGDIDLIGEVPGLGQHPQVECHSEKRPFRFDVALTAQKEAPCPLLFLKDAEDGFDDLLA